MCCNKTEREAPGSFGQLEVHVCAASVRSVLNGAAAIFCLPVGTLITGAGAAWPQPREAEGHANSIPIN